MAEYRVNWEIDIEAYSAYEAALEARRIQLDPDSTALLYQCVVGPSSWCEVVDLIDGSVVRLPNIVEGE